MSESLSALSSETRRFEPPAAGDQQRLVLAVL